MEFLRYAIYIAGILVFFKLLLYGISIKRLLGIRFKKGDCELHDLSELPSYLRELFDAYEKELEGLGFHFSHTQIFDEPVVSEHSRRWNLVYFKPAEKCYATVSVSSIPDQNALAKVEFATVFSDDHKLITLNGMAHDTMGNIPNTIVMDPYAESLEKQFQAHLGEFARLREKKKPIAMEPTDFVLSEKKTADDYIDGLEANGFIRKTDESYYQLRLIPCLRHTYKCTKGLRKLKKQQAKIRKLSQTQRAIAVEIPVEVEVEAFSKIREITSAKKTGYAGKLAVLLVSLLLFTIAFGFSFSFGTVLIFIAALFIHESGHVIGMRLFKYKDVQVVFLPFLGAATLGGEKEATPLQRVIVYLLGPAFGMVIGILCVFIGGAYEVRPLMGFGAFSLILSYLNLVPIIPLDGGRVFELVLFSRISFLKSAFMIGSVAVMAIVGIGLKDPILVGLSVFLCLGVSTQISQNRALSRLKKQIKDANLEITDEDILPTIFRILREKPFSKLPFARKYAVAYHLSDNVMQKLPTVWTILLSLLMYFVVLLLPIMMIIEVAIIRAFWEI
ncbi:MAG TPA: site-2 protease family protein [Sedimentisphaerales bacterium]|nr:site-2 protease family protein [Sedimentisphaerales bacterium]